MGKWVEGAQEVVIIPTPAFTLSPRQIHSGAGGGGQGEETSVIKALSSIAMFIQISTTVDSTATQWKIIPMMHVCAGGRNWVDWRWVLLPNAPHSYGDTSWKVCSSHNGFHGNAISLEEQKYFSARKTERDQFGLLHMVYWAYVTSVEIARDYSTCTKSLHLKSSLGQTHFSSILKAIKLAKPDQYMAVYGSRAGKCTLCVTQQGPWKCGGEGR